MRPCSWEHTLWKCLGEQLGKGLPPRSREEASHRSLGATSPRSKMTAFNAHRLSKLLPSSSSSMTFATHGPLALPQAQDRGDQSQKPPHSPPAKGHRGHSTELRTAGSRTERHSRPLRLTVVFPRMPLTGNPGQQLS